MGTKMKGLYKGFKYTLSHMFVVKDREIEISQPTDVKHVAHIGWDGASGGGAPSWMNEFKTGPDFAATSIGRSASTFSPWSSQGKSANFSGSLQQQSESDLSKDAFPTELGVVKKKDRRKKTTKSSTSSPTSNSISSRRSSRGAKMKSKCIETDSKQVDIKVP